MLKYPWIYFILPALAAAAILTVSASEDKPFKNRLIDFVEAHRLTEDTQIISLPYDHEQRFSIIADKRYKSYGYNRGDWERLITLPEYGSLTEEQKKTILVQTEDDFSILSYGSMKLNLKYGGSVYTDPKYKQYDTDSPVSRLIQPGFLPEQQMQIHMEGKIGKRLTVYVDHDSTKKDNKYKIQYKAVRDDELIREINAGDIDIKFNHSKYAVYDNTTSKGMGIDITLKKNNFQVKAFGSITKGQTEIEYFRGNSSPGSNKLAEYNFTKRMYYQLEPFKRYDNIPSVPDQDTIDTSITMTSDLSSPKPYTPNPYVLTPVNIDPNGFALYMDAQNPYANYNAIQVPSADPKGNYTKLAQGIDYTINYSTGLITFLRDIPGNAKIFAVYTIDGGRTDTTDPGAYRPGLTPDPEHPGGIFAGKLFVFIKYGYSIKDLIDTRIHVDCYEIRSFYQIGDRMLLTDNFSLKFYLENQLMDQTNEKKIGKYSVDYSRGLIQFTLREPFKTLLNSLNPAAVNIIYSENQPTSTYTYSRYNLKIDYYREARSFQLKHFNIIPNSVRVKVNDIELSTTLYTVDYVSGFLMFMDPNNPVIGPETKIEIKYEYLPFLGQSQAFIGGLRADYKIVDGLNFGGSLLYSNSSGNVIIPQIGNTPTSLFLFEGDVSLNLNEKKMANVVNTIAGTDYKTVPVEFNAYAEYARSYNNINTFGKALIDNMQGANDIIPISTSEKEWQLGSMPVGYNNTNRAMLNYFFYRDPGSPGSLLGPGYSATPIDYRIKSGPYNVATGHIPFNITPEASQRSLVFDLNFDYEGNAPDYENVASVVTRKLSSTAVDFSGLQYIEISYLYQGSADISIQFDLGKINEDSDANGILGTEDLNRNGILDSDPSRGYYEDVGFDFYGYKFNGNATAKVGGGPKLNSETIGDGVLNSEDLNGNGILDYTTLPESIYSISQAVVASAEWKTLVIPVDPALFTPEQKNILKQVEALRLSIIRTNGGATGKLYIDSIKFVALKWSDIQKAVGDKLEPSIVSTITDPEYSANSFLLTNPDAYKQLYGDKSSSDLARQTDSSLQLEYNIALGPPAAVSVTRRFPGPMDLRFYKTMNLWLNARQSSPGDQIGITIGSSDSDYIEYRFNMNNDGAWREIRMILKDGSSGSISGTVTGYPDMKRIIFMKTTLYSGSGGSSGKLWINNIYTSEPEVQEDSAHWVETELKITKPFFVTKGGTPVFSDFMVKYTTKGYGANFSTLGKKDSDISEMYHELVSSVKILPNWNTLFSMLIEDSATDNLNDNVINSKRGKRNYSSYFVASDYLSNINGVPTIKLSYKNDSYKQNVTERINTSIINKTATSSIHAPLITMIEKIDNFLWGKMSATFNMNMLFKEEGMSRDLGPLPSSATEKRQKSIMNVSLDYQNKIFYIQPNFGMGSEEIVNLTGQKDTNNLEIQSSVNGNFHAPFIYGDGNDLRFVEKNMLTGFTIGINQSHYVSPQYKMDVNYLENNFKDFNFSGSSIQEFKRIKDARSFVSTQIILPINLHKIPELKFFKKLSFTYMRSLYLSESLVPYEGEGVHSLNEQYGINRAMNSIIGAGLNIFQYWPGYFFTGRNNYAAGRDYVSSTINTNTPGTVLTGYNNSLRLIDNFSFNWMLDFDKVAIISAFGLNQVAERLNLYGVSQQVITIKFNINFSFDFMKLIAGGIFFRPNQPGKPYHALTIDLGYNLDNNMLITSNIEEMVHTPSFGFTIKWGRSNVGIKAGLDYKERYLKEFILNDGGLDSIYAQNIPGNTPFKNIDTGYKVSLIFETDVNWLYKFFALFYKLTASPIFTFEYLMAINRYDYTITVSPQPYDSYLFNMKLTLDLHKNIQGGIFSRFALEQYRSWLTTGISREVFSYEVGLNFTLIF